jgi:NAD(P)-dependent dehydrogenase (short-subunit alcohol dehydrogenase family)
MHGKLARSVGYDDPAMNAFDLSGRCAVVVGGTTGLGREIALGLARAGANVVPTSRRSEQVDEAAAAIEAEGVRTLRLCSDVLQRESLEALHAAVIAEFGGIEILVNAAGITSRIPTIDCPEETWQRIFDTNLTGTLRTSQIFGKTMLEQKRGSIINLASLASFVAFHEVAAYGASKAGVAALTKSLAIEFAPKNVRVNAIAPGIFPTDLNRELLFSTARGREELQRTPMARFGRLEEIAGAAVFLASDAASFVTGEILTVDGGYLASGVNQ